MSRFLCEFVRNTLVLPNRVSEALARRLSDLPLKMAVSGAQPPVRKLATVIMDLKRERRKAHT
jgi:hypothetical protein